MERERYQERASFDFAWICSRLDTPQKKNGDDGERKSVGGWGGKENGDDEGLNHSPQGTMKKPEGF